jgi:AAA15 family ATPase/GTPase
MLRCLAIAHYRSIRELVMPLGPLNLATGPNGRGKSNLYRALRLLAGTAQGDRKSQLRAAFPAPLSSFGALPRLRLGGSREMPPGTREDAC